MRCVKHNKIFCFSRHCRGELRWTGWPAPRVPVPPPAAPQAGRGPRLAGVAGDNETLGAPIAPAYRPAAQQRPVRQAAPRQRQKTSQPAEDDLNSLNNPISPLHQATYGGPFYGTVADTPGSDGGTSSSSGGSSGGSSGYDSGSSSSGSSSSDSGSSSSSSCD